jgi:DNA topoisomerase 2-associated protein PAT1
MFASALQAEDHGPAAAAAAPPAARPSLFLDVPEPEAPTPKPKLGSIALGGLLAASTPTEAAFSGSLASGSGSFLAPPSSFAPSPQPVQHSPGMPQYGGQPATPPRAMTAAELEAQFMGGDAAGGGMPPMHMHMPPPPQPYPGMQMYPGMMQGPPPPMYFSPHGAPPPGYGLPYGMPPPPGFPGGPMPQQPQPGVFTPEMIMQQQAQQQAAQRAQAHAQAQAQAQAPPPMQPPPAFAAPPPPLGGGMPRPAPGPRPAARPSAAGPRPSPGAGGPPRPQPTGPAPHPHANLAQRLRALNLAERPPAERHPPAQRRRHASRYMPAEEVESILYMQWRGLHQGPAYTEDYYYQAFVFKHYGRRNRRHFCPESGEGGRRDTALRLPLCCFRASVCRRRRDGASKLYSLFWFLRRLSDCAFLFAAVRELAPTERMAADEVAFVRLEGLGKMPFSNIRRPRPLMDVSPEDLKAVAAGAAAGAGAEGAPEGGAAPAAPARRLEQEPMLAARIMIEDCMALILDVQDIDRIFVAAAGAPVENEAALRQRRALLVDGLAASLRLPETPSPGAPAPAGGLSDGVFLRLLALPKGKNLAACALRLLYPPQEEAGAAGAGTTAAAAAAKPNLRVLWAVLRNLRSLFGDAPAPPPPGSRAAAAAADQVATAAKVAAAAAEALKRLHSPGAVCDALRAITAGDLDGAAQLEANPEAVLMPLFAPGEGAADRRYPWLADALAGLLQRAAELELSTAVPAGKGAEGEGGAGAGAAWGPLFAGLYGVAHRHAAALLEALEAAREDGDEEGAGEVKRLMPVPLIRSLLPLCSQPQEEELRAVLNAVGA